MKSSLKLGSLASLGALLLCTTTPAAADQRLRVQVDQRGDFIMVGNTLGWDCGAGADMPVVGLVSNNCGSNTGDSSPDMFWRSDDPAAGQATADLSTTAAQARSSALLQLPDGATPTHAFLYWGATRPVNSPADTTVVLERPGEFTENLTALTSYTRPITSPLNQGVAYQSVADVTDLVMAHGSGVYRVSGVEASAFANASQDVLFAGWSLVVLYQLDSEPPRNLAIFDGLDSVSSVSGTSDVSLSGFLVPNAGFDAKLGVLTYEGDESFEGDQLLFGTAPLGNGDVLSDAQNPSNNFFNGTRSSLGSPVSVAGDLPQLEGTASTMAGMDIDIVDVTSRMSPGQTRVDVRVTTSLDEFYLGAFVTSISTFRPDFISSEKTVRDVNGGYVKPGDELEYTITVKNTGNDASDKTVVEDPLPDTVTFVPGSLTITSGANAGPKTDAAGDDQALYDAASHTLVVNLGTGATAAQGGSIPAGESSVFTFRVAVKDGVNGLISNQGSITAGGARGAPPVTTLTDGNADGPGNPPTEIPTGECQGDDQCGGSMPYCDTTAVPPICVECTMDSQCKDPNGVCDPATHTCVECTMDSQCMGPNAVCDVSTNTCVECTMDSQCMDPNQVCDVSTNTCVECTMDSQCMDPEAVCDLSTNTCVECTMDSQCMAPEAVCDLTSHTCVQCTMDSQCMGPESLCDLTSHTCICPDMKPGSCTDADGDGLSDDTEVTIGTDPHDADSDDDGVRDGDETDYGDDTDGDGKINALDPDSDDDGILDGTEQGKGCDDPATDTSRGNCVPDADGGATTTSPVNADTDGGGLSDGDEDTNHDGAIDPGEGDPNDPCDDNAVHVCSNIESLAGAGGCSARGGSTQEHSAALWLSGVFAALWIAARRRRGAC